ncbi:mCG124991 [Mus musculus]|nr:mCG124991 [Mus musculus]
MPQEDIHFGYPRKGHRRSYVTAEEAAGIGILIVVLGIALLIGCWYCRRRSGYRTLMVPNAPPAYEKLSSPPPYSP